LTSQRITCATSYPVVLTRLCANKCGYCLYPHSYIEPLPSKKRLLCNLHKAATRGASLINVSAGEGISEHPEIIETVAYYGLADYLSYLCFVSKCITSVNTNYCLFPQMDIGLLSYAELKILRKYFLSYKLLLESVDPTLQASEAHRQAPDKEPRRRIEALINAGRVKIPTTSGLLVGIGESKGSRVRCLEILAEIHRRYENIQSVEIKRFIPYKRTPMGLYPPPSADEMVETVSAARRILPPDIVIQVSALENQEITLEAVKAGARDIGEFPLNDENNQSTYSRQLLLHLEEELSRHGFKLEQRLPIFPVYIRNGWYSMNFRDLIQKYFQGTTSQSFLSKLRSASHSVQ
jgi:FO synthase subunit 1